MNSESTIPATEGPDVPALPSDAPRDLRREFANAMRKCTPKQRAWIRKLPEHNFQLWGVAMSSLGLSTKTVYTWLRQDRIKAARQLQDEIATEDADITQRRIIAEYARLAFSDLRQAFNASGELLPPSQWTDEMAAAIAGVETQEKRLRDPVSGEWVNEYELVRKIKVHDKLKALEFLAKFKNMVGPERVELTGKDGKALAAPTIYIGGPGEPEEPDGTDGG